MSVEVKVSINLVGIIIQYCIVQYFDSFYTSFKNRSPHLEDDAPVLGVLHCLGGKERQMTCQVHLKTSGAFNRCADHHLEK